MTKILKKVSEGQSNYYQSLLEEHGKSVDAVASGDQIHKTFRHKKLAR